MQQRATWDETKRLSALAACAVMDTPRETAFDNIVFTTAQLFRVPMAILTLVDADRVWAKASVGPVQSEWRRAESFCHTVVTFDELIAVEDAAADPRFLNLPGVTISPLVRFFAGTPLRGPGGAPVGALCVMDRLSRTITDRQRMHLLQLAHEAGELLRLRVPDLDLDLARRTAD